MSLITGLITGSIVIGMYLPMFNPGEAIFYISPRRLFYIPATGSSGNKPTF